MSLSASGQNDLSWERIPAETTKEGGMSVQRISSPVQQLSIPPPPPPPPC